MDPWITPAVSGAVAVFNNRQAIGKAWDKVLSKTVGPGFNVAVVGEAGVGKTVLMDHLVGDAFSSSYVPPGQSPVIERDSRKRNKHRYKFSVVPGQPVHRDRIRDLDDALAGNKKLDGVIYVVANGFHELRSTFADDIAMQMSFGNLEDLRKGRIDAELADFRETLKILRRSIRENRQPGWVLIAANKADLYASKDDLAAAQSAYLGPDSGFRAAMEELRGQVGSDNLMWSAVPVCSWLEPYRVGDDVVPSSLSIPQRNLMLGSFFGALERICQGRR